MKAKLLRRKRSYVLTVQQMGSLPAYVVVPWLPSGGTGVFNCRFSKERALPAMITTPLRTI